MKLYSSEECEKWIGYKKYFNSTVTHYMFSPRNEKDELIDSEEVINIIDKSFHHNTQRILHNIEQLSINFPKVKQILEDLMVFMCPKPSLGSFNACASTNFIIYYARGTQIPTFMTDYITGHEMGHVIQYGYCCKRLREEKFREYLTLRNAPKGICKVYVRYDEEKEQSVYEDKEDFIFIKGDGKQQNPDWDENPQEWFAEDFRYLFGVDKGEPYWGLPIDQPDNKIKEFMLSL